MYDIRFQPCLRAANTLKASKQNVIAVSPFHISPLFLKTGPEKKRSSLIAFPCTHPPTHTHLRDESSGGALSNPEGELPLLPLSQLSFSAGGDEDGILVYQRLMKNLKTHR